MAKLPRHRSQRRVERSVELDGAPPGKILAPTAGVCDLELAVASQYEYTLDLTDDLEGERMIDVQLTDSTDGYKFHVTVREKGTATRHRVTMSEASYLDLSGGAASPERVIKAAFGFLLDREPKESILTRFDVTVISDYFPEFEREIGRYL